MREQSRWSVGVSRHTVMVGFPFHSVRWRVGGKRNSGQWVKRSTGGTESGFSLIELMVASFIFMIVLGMVFVTTDSVMTTSTTAFAGSNETVLAGQTGEELSSYINDANLFGAGMLTSSSVPKCSVAWCYPNGKAVPGRSLLYAPTPPAGSNPLVLACPEEMLYWGVSQPAGSTSVYPAWYFIYAGTSPGSPPGIYTLKMISFPPGSGYAATLVGQVKSTGCPSSVPTGVAAAINSAMSTNGVSDALTGEPVSNLLIDTNDLYIPPSSPYNTDNASSLFKYVSLSPGTYLPAASEGKGYYSYTGTVTDIYVDVELTSRVKHVAGAVPQIGTIGRFTDEIQIDSVKIDQTMAEVSCAGQPSCAPIPSGGGSGGGGTGGGGGSGGGGGTGSSTLLTITINNGSFTFVTPSGSLSAAGLSGQMSGTYTSGTIDIPSSGVALNPMSASLAGITANVTIEASGSVTGSFSGGQISGLNIPASVAISAGSYGGCTYSQPLDGLSGTISSSGSGTLTASGMAVGNLAAGSGSLCSILSGYITSSDKISISWPVTVSPANP